MSTHPNPSSPGGTTRPERLPRLDEIVTDARRYGEQMLAVLERSRDPWSEPDIQAWPAMDSPIRVHELLLAHAVESLKYTLRELEKVAALPLPDAPVAAPVAAGEEGPGVPPDPGAAADRAALAARVANGCAYDTGLCLCPGPPFAYAGCRAR